jgi:hypothetical protein
LILTTFRCSAGVAGLTTRVGYFDASNGVFFEMAGAAAGVVKRSYVTGSPVDTRIEQSAWNIDPLDGTGPSGVTLDPTKVQIFWTAFEWLGVGSVFCGFVVDGVFLPVHAFHHANSLTSVYMSTPNFPVLWEASSTWAYAVGIEAICASVMSEGGQEEVGALRSADRGASAITSSSTNVYQVIGLRLATGRDDAIAFKEISLLCSTTANAHWQLLRNPTFTGGTAASWTSAGTESPIEYDISRTGTISGGTLTDSGYFSSRTNQLAVDLTSFDGLGRDNAGASDEIVLAVRSLAAAGEQFYGSISWLEPF